MMRVLITGGAGCLGSSLVKDWCHKGYDVTVIDNFLTGSPKQIAESKGVNLIEADVNDRNYLSQVVETCRPEVVVHAAAAYKDPNDWETDVETNISGSINLIRALKGLSCLKKIVNLQTITCYGNPEPGLVDETHPLRPVSSYGISKVAGESYMINSDLPVISLRLASVTGPYLFIGPIPTFYNRLKQGRSCFCSDAKRDFLDIKDFLAFFDKVITSDVSRGVYNVASGVSNSILSVYELVADHLGHVNGDVPIVPVADDDIAELPLDVRLAQGTFEWEPNISFEDTIKNQLNWYDENGVETVRSHLKQPKS